MGERARATKLTLFNKTPDANWLIRWHQDAPIAVREQREVPGCFGWSVREGVVRVHPPAEVLEKVLAIRLHLDDALKVRGDRCLAEHPSEIVTHDEIDALELRAELKTKLRKGLSEERNRRMSAAIAEHLADTPESCHSIAVGACSPR